MSRPAKKLCPEFWDPTGADHGGLPTYWWRGAPDGLATRRQLRADGLRPGGQPIVAQILWYRGAGVRVAYLYRVDLAAPKRTATAAQLAGLEVAMRARRTCGSCGVVREYCIPLSLGECIACHYPHDDTDTDTDPRPDPLIDVWTESTTELREAA